MRRGDRHFPSSPPRNYVTPSERRHDYHSRQRPVVYQVYGSMPEMGNTFPGGFSPVRTSSHRSLRNNISPPSPLSYDEHLYASFSPPRSGRHGGRGSGNGNSSIFRPKQPKQLPIIVARGSSSHDDSSNCVGGSGSKMTSPPQPDSHTIRSKDISLSRSPVSAFPAKLHAILSSSEYNEYITWLPHGRAWRVLKPKEFEGKIIPKFFRSSKYASFMRQVNGWGFRRITTPGPDFNAYWHELFLRGLPDLCDRMKRPQKTDPELKHEDPPDFYRVSKYSPLPDPDYRGRESATSDHEVSHSSSMSSNSCAAVSKEHGKDSPRADVAESSHPSVDSWDRSDDQKGVSNTEVAINLSGVYDKEDSRGLNKLSEADFHYLVQQNRALIKQAHLQQSRFRSIDG